MRLGVPKEVKRGETRVAATPKTVEQLIKLGYDVVVEAGAGEASAYPDQAYVDAGASLESAEQVWASDIVAKVNAPTDEEVPRLRSGAILASLLAPALNPDKVEALRAQGVTALAMDAVPRISRAQSLDVLSSMANIAGYRAVVESAHEFGGLFTGQVTAAGKVPPAKVLVDGQHRRLPRRRGVGARVRRSLHRSGDGRGQGAAGQGARLRRRCGRSGRDRCGRLPRRDRARLRRAARGGRAGRVDGGGVPPDRRRAGGLVRRLRQGDR